MNPPQSATKTADVLEKFSSIMLQVHEGSCSEPNKGTINIQIYGVDIGKAKIYPLACYQWQDQLDLEIIGLSEELYSSLVGAALFYIKSKA